MGLPSLWAASTGAQITATDCHPGSLTLMRRSVSLNNLKNMEVEHFDWVERPQWLDGSFDLVIGSDIVYDGQCISDIFSSVSAALRHGGIFLLANVVRGSKVGLTAMLPCAESNGLELINTPIREPGTVAIYRFAKRK